ncbi:MAG: GPR endopeptidase [Firmicutes bacterium]|nr:GPR endopeptidase [Bacillota bacterium]
MQKTADRRAESAHTDLALESMMLVAPHGEEIPGLRRETREQNGIRITQMLIESEEASRQLAKVPGHYATLEIPQMRNNDPAVVQTTIEVLAEALRPFLEGLNKEDLILVVGLGNQEVTADAVGPLVVGQLFVTRHLIPSMAAEVAASLRPLAALAPGVLGTTGIETAEVIRGVVQQVKPAMVIAVDALAARELARLNTTLQIADVGIHPGAGVGNRRMALDAKTLGVPTLAIGVPTVVDAATIVEDAMELLERRTRRRTTANPFPPSVGSRSSRYALIRDSLAASGQDLVVTVKEVDAVVARMAKAIAGGLTVAVHPGVTLDDVDALLNL